MKRLGTAVLLLIVVAGCDRELSREPLASRLETQRLDCSKLSYCFTCLPGFDGEASCGFKMSPYCPGTQSADVKLTPVEVTYKSGRVATMTYSQVVKFNESCQ